MHDVAYRAGLQLLPVLYFFVPAYLANMAPVVVRGHCEWLARPMDGGCSWRGRRVLGDHKTWRGLLAGVVVGAVAFAAQRWLWQRGVGRDVALIDYGAFDPLVPGALLGLGAGLGDALKSFCKRRVGIAPGASWIGFDQLDFMVGAYALVSLVHAPPLGETLAILPIVFAASVATTAAAFWLSLKDAWI